MGEVQVTRRHGYRSFFWPLLLIGIGSIWLLVNLGVFNIENVSVLARLWPLLLVAAGLDLLFGRSSPMLGAIIGIGAVLGMLLLMFIGPSMGLVSLPELQSVQYEEAIDDAQSAQIVLDFGVNAVQVNALSDSRNLFTADLRYYGEVGFDVSGESAKTVTLEQQGNSVSGGVASFLMSIFGAEQQDSERDADWNIGLNRDVPVQLDVNAGVGNTNLDLRELALTGLNVDSGVGNVDVMLPTTDEEYLVDIDGGVGSISITLPEGIEVQIDAKIGVGNMNLPSILNRVDGNDDGDGIWETEGYRSASTKITIKFNGGVGSLTVR